MRTRMLPHAKVCLALHELRGGEGRPLLLLHGLGERSPASVPEAAATWPGPVHALDFTGHGGSTVPRGGGYTCEILMADADTALAALGPLGAPTLLGRGLGAYIALLLAGARPEGVRGAVLTDGPGLFGGAGTATSPSIVTLPSTDGPPADGAPPDPYALVELSRDVRPPDYATSFARQAAHVSGLETPITVAALGRPPWLEAVTAEPGVQTAPVEDGLALYAPLA